MADHKYPVKVQTKALEPGELHIIGPQFSSFTRTVQFCCEELELNYSLGLEYQGSEYALRSQALLELNPFGKVPVLLYRGQALFESQAICRFLDNQFNGARLQPDDPWQQAQMAQWCAAITQYVDKAIVRDYLLEFVFPRGEGGQVRLDKVEAAVPDILRMVTNLECQLGDREYLVAGQFTLADIQLMPIAHYLVGAPRNDQLVAESSPLRAYVARLLARPSARKVFV